MDLLASALLILFWIVTSSLSSGESTFDVIQYGAVGDGHTDDSAAFLKAWEALCRAGGDSPALEIPAGKTFLVGSVIFRGPCKSNSVSIQISGNIVAPGSVRALTDSNDVDCWLCFYDVAGFIMRGPGTMDGRDSTWWQENGTPMKPRAMFLHKCNNFDLSGFTIVNSPSMHISVNQCNGGSISGVHLNSPANSPNTDGIDLSFSTQIHILDSFIAVGDDCIAINGDCSNINISGIACGPGHGISIGSLGDGGEDDKVEEIHVRNCKFTGTENGARIKTFPEGSGYARKITFEEITLIGSKNPIIINQHYSSSKMNSVIVSDVTFTSVHGTSASVTAITLDCCHSGCTNIVMDQVNITSVDPGKVTTSFCKNAQGTATSTAPDVPCLDHHKHLGSGSPPV